MNKQYGDIKVEVWKYIPALLCRQAIALSMHER